MLTKKLSEYDLIIGFDLSTYKTGVCFYNIKNQTIITSLINERKSSNTKELDLYKDIYELLSQKINEYGSEKKILIVREAPPMQMGIHTTIKTIISLTKSHGILSLVLQELKIDEYNEFGIFPVSIKSIFKTETNPKPTKEIIRKKLAKIYNFEESEITLDESDAIAVIHCLINKKINLDILTEIKNIKKEIKLTKSDLIKSRRLKDIETLQSFLI